MSAQEPRPYALLTLDESDEATLVLAQAHALADLLNCVYRFPDGGPNPESLAWISALLFEYVGNIEDLINTGRKRAAESRMVKDPEPQAAAQA